ncbi:MAG: LTA synthase family protein [Gemmatimonadales bacterium]
MRGRLTVFGLTFGYWLVFFWAARLLFLAYHYPQTATLGAGELLRTFGQGFRLDASGAAYLTAVPTLLLILATLLPMRTIARRLAFGWVAVVTALGALMIAADLELFRHWDHRIDGGVIRYLATPAEALASTGGTPRLLLLAIAVLLAGASLWLYRRVVHPAWQRLGRIHPAWALPLILLPGLLVIPARGGTQTVSLTASSAYFSRNQFANIAAGNTLWGFFDSLAHGGGDRENPYRRIDPADAAGAIEAARAPAGPARPAPLTVTRPNVLLVIWESASARAFASLGGIEGVTPKFDALTHEGLLFRRCYAAGDRTDKGLAAILSGFPALPKGSILMVPDKAATLPKLGRDFGAGGYHTAFYYGGELEFASMQAYLLGSGFDRVVGKDDFPAESWNSKWGAHDGVVADRLLADLDKETEPFFTVWLTLSSHEPFETPAAPRFPGPTWFDGYRSAMAYTDETIGDLVARARARPWWDRTLVVIIADHGRRVVPLDEKAPLHDADALFRIPMLWLGGALAVRDSASDEIASQLDVAPTLAALAGLPGAGPYPWGRSLLTPVARPHGYYGFEGGFGLVTERGNLVSGDGRGLDATRGMIDPTDERLGRSLLQATYQDYLDRAGAGSAMAPAGSQRRTTVARSADRIGLAR